MNNKMKLMEKKFAKMAKDNNESPSKGKKKGPGAKKTSSVGSDAASSGGGAQNATITSETQGEETKSPPRRQGRGASK